MTRKIYTVLAIKNLRTTAIIFATLAFIFTQVLTPNTLVRALGPDDVDAIYNWPLWNPAVGGTGTCGNSTVTLQGSDAEDKIFNFLTHQGLSGAQAAGIMGNLQQESGFNPGAHQTSGAWSDMGTDYGQAVGLAQWDGGNRPAFIKAGEAAGLTLQGLESGSDQNLEFQLQYLWKEMEGSAPTGAKDILAGLKKITQPDQAAAYFVKLFESGTDPGGVRESNAISIYSKYGKGNGTAGGSSSAGSCSSPATSCASNGTPATGDAKIYCEAVQFDPASYSESATGNHMGGGNPEWIKAVCPGAGQNPVKVTPSCYVDCSGLVNISVYLAFGYDLKENTTLEAADTSHWKHIPFSQVQRGDLIQPAAEAGGHVEIVDHVQGNTIYTFGAHTSHAPQAQQVSAAQFTHSAGDLYLHWIGQTQ